MSEIICSIITQPAGHGMKKRWNFVSLCCKKTKMEKPLDVASLKVVSMTALKPSLGIISYG